MANGDQVVIEPQSGWLAINWREVWQSRELLYFLTWRDLKVRYKQTVLGVAWALLEPFIRLVVLTLIFGRVARLDAEGYPYAVFLFSALLPWQFFSNALRRAGDSLISDANLVQKVYFPRLIIPLSSVGSSLVDLAFGCVILAGLMAWYGVSVGPRLLALAPLIVATLLVALGVGTLLSALTAVYRDFRYVATFLVQIWFFLTPVVWSLTVLPARLRPLAALNPMCGVVEGCRSALLPGRPFEWPLMALSAAVAAALFLVGLYVFRQIEKGLADII
jgi:homopolymeric O-antigen transport system permease protein